MSLPSPRFPRRLSSLGRALGQGMVAAAAPLAPMAGPLVDGMVDRVDAWARSSQQVARRNAMVASTRLAARRAEILEVEEFLADRERGHGTGAGERRATSV